MGSSWENLAIQLGLKGLKFHSKYIFLYFIYFKKSTRGVAQNLDKKLKNDDLKTTFTLESTSH